MTRYTCPRTLPVGGWMTYLCRAIQNTKTATPKTMVLSPNPNHAPTYFFARGVKMKLPNDPALMDM